MVQVLSFQRTTEFLKLTIPIEWKKGKCEIEKKKKNVARRLSTHNEAYDCS